MALKKRKRTLAEFSMASMTDMIFLLLIFFMITSTIVVPNAVKVLLPQGSKQTASKPMTKVTINADLQYFVAYGNQRERRVAFEEITPFLQDCYNREPDIFVALYADESVPYREVMRIVDIANQNNFRILLMIRPK